VHHNSPSIPEAKFGYKPTPAQLSIGYIAQHIANDDYLFCNNFGAMKGTRPAEDSAVTVIFGGNSRTVARAGMVLGHAMDLADHYSQLANYMRLNNIIPPSALPRPRPAGN